MKKRLPSLCFSLALAFGIGLASGCGSNQTFKPGQKLSGRYNTVVSGSQNSYLFKEDGTFEHTGFGKDGKGTESGTYSIDGKKVTFNVGGKSVATNISASKGDANKQSPEGLYIDVESYELAHSGLTKATPTPAASNKDNAVPAEYEKYAPAQVGAFARNSFFTDKPDPDYHNRVVTHFLYDGRNYLDIMKYSSAADAQADYQKRVSAAVPEEDYARKVKLPKCDPDQETDYETPEVLVKRIQRWRGGEAVVFHSARFWDYKCQVSSNGEEDVMWTDGALMFVIETSRQNGADDAFGQAEAFFNDYQKATEQ